MGSRCLGSTGPALRVSGPFPFAAPFLLCSAPPSQLQPKFHPRLALSDAVSALVEKEAIEIVPPSPGFYSRLLVTPKVSGGWRPVIDLSRLSGWVELSHFHMETAQSVLQSLHPEDWMVSLDLQDSYLQVPVHPALSPLPEVLRGGCGVPVSGPVLRSVDDPSGVHRASWLLSFRLCIVAVSICLDTSTIG